MDGGIEIVVPGPPVPWASQAVNRKTGNRFIPSRQAEASSKVVAVVRALEAAGELEPFPRGQPVALLCEFVCKRPADHWGTGRNAGVLKPAHRDAMPTGRPDLSNLLKLIEDGLVLSNLIPDDDQVVQAHASKRYQLTPEEGPRSVAFIRPVSPAVKSVTMPSGQPSLLEEGEPCVAT